MGQLLDVLDWLRDAANWRGSTGAGARIIEHVEISAVAMIAAVLIAVPPALWLGHKRRFGLLAINISNVGRALPSFAVLVLGTQLLGLLEKPVIGSVSVFVALVALAVPPIVTNTYVGMAEVSDDVRDAARGMGLSEVQILRRVELPLAIPLIMAGVRTSAVQVVATATIAAQLGFGGLGRFIIDGYAVRASGGYTDVLAGAVLVAALALVTEGLLGLVQRALTPKGLRTSRRRSDLPDLDAATDDPATRPLPAAA
ncbi:ABC transporter permease [Iamia sp.]|uniref:ABC transporter permease n=1 Tax=Iamia sp. TaxID=2722710 RepID=UPI002D003F2B|nr:ABC transporter permease [Iamia sp.]HXH56650.1 ABC transporter permease [Iamia sp.]